MAGYVFRGTVTEFCKYGGKAKEYRTKASSLNQAKVKIRIRFNREHGFVEDKYVEMKNVSIYEPPLSPPPPKLSS